ncbi:electron transfer flavoprotein subunit beta/FixA family protein [Actinotalea sp. M2MS4P-6]|uniref:electron transfer flavoprotein subunit beta/FixA family protein n=1 Tax=Actinotalea sp. M2MS4P-6 TaxID=2983762 RepID=UPI0021E429B2|nr:electron transfer flavoprotein subunit beta/FixA family protein [Actinotalea sp. M2MS4P-6]MCV2396232.1 electron transfer flavoprotein subunit beta/FixA family protein [Actinotalea sp. M2MS4P-6]
MKILVLVKVVPDTYKSRALSLETGLADRNAEDAVLDEIGERALEVALAHADAHTGTEVVVLAMAPELAQASLRKALAMGASAAVQVTDERLVGADVVLTAQVLAAAARHLGFDLLVAGNASTDGSGGAVPAAMAELLAVPCATSLSEVELTEAAVTGTRVTEGAALRIEAPLPAVISITEALPDARLPSFKGIMAAKKKPLDAMALDDLDVDPDATDAARSIMIAVRERPPRTAGVKIVDSGDAGARLADFLVENRLA